MFHKAPIKDSKCIPILTQILYLLHQGETLTTTEATDVFFATSKLFQSKSLPLRRMVYLVIKELASKADDVIMITAVVMKDLNSDAPMLKANSVRVLCDVTEPSMLGQIERYIMQAIVDKNNYVASAALVSAMHLMGENKDIVKRWVSQVNEALKSRAVMVQYHALGLLFKIKQQDRLAVTRMVQTLTKASTLRCPYATCLLIRLTAHTIAEDTSGSPDPSLFDYLELCLRHKSEMVIYEAARAVCNIPQITARELAPAITVLHLLLGSSKASHRYAAVRTLNKVAMTHPVSVTQCVVDLEALVKDSNRSVATLAITTLLKIGSESSVERLMKQMSEFMGEIPDEFKVVVIQAIRSLCLRYPKKHRMMISFLASTLREEGGYEFKKTVVDTIMLLIERIPEAADSGLSQLCEFIEDCDFPILSIRVLNLLGSVGPAAPSPSRFIRYIYNRVILEVAPVRAAAVSTLAKFGLAVAELRPAIIVLLNRCVFDTDDEVRDRCAMYVALLESGLDGPEAAMFLDESPLPLYNLEEALLEYQATPSRTPFDLAAVEPDVVRPGKHGVAPGSTAGSDGPVAPESMAGLSGSSGPSASAAELIASVPELASLGAPYASSKPCKLTEDETEYQVNVIKHAFASAVVLQFNITNTLNDFYLADVNVAIELVDGDEDFQIAGSVPAKAIPYGVPGVAWVALSKEATAFPVSSFACTLKFRVFDADTETGQPIDGDEGELDEYEVDVVDIVSADYMQNSFVPNFAAAWEAFDPEAHQSLELFSLSSLSSVPEAVKTLIDLMGMQVCERSNAVKADAVSHTLLLSAQFAGQVPVLVRIRLKLDASRVVQMELAVRSELPYVRSLIMSLI